MTATLVLVVDDDPAVLKLIELTLVAAGFNVLSFDDPRDAAAELEEGLRPDVIVSDVSMPGLDGFEFYKRVRTYPELHAIPFLFLTAMEDRSYVRQGMTLGADDYLTKPFERQELVDAVRIRLQRIEELRHPLEGTVRARGLGHPFIERNGKRLDWDSLKALELLFYMLEHRNGVTTFEVAEALWPGKTEAKASSSFHTTLYRLRKVMGGELVESANRRYYLRREFRIDYDVDQYRAAGRKARDSASPDGFEQAVRLYGGHFLIGFDSAWVEEARQALHAEHLSLLQAAAELAQKRSDLEAATRYFQSMTEHEPFSETAWNGLARTWESRGEPGKAEKARGRFAALMAES
ncbi:MAG: response regulator [Trueperaceae bacterium]